MLERRDTVVIGYTSYSGTGTAQQITNDLEKMYEYYIRHMSMTTSNEASGKIETVVVFERID